jgi:hypothetical protein
MKVPSRKQTEEFIREAEHMNPGPWAPRSLNVARAAEAIA